MLTVQPFAAPNAAAIGDRIPAESRRAPSTAAIALLLFTIAVRFVSAAPVFSTTVPGAAHMPGAFGTMWLSDLHLSNPATRSASATVKFISASGTLQRSVPIPASGSLMMTDVVAQLGGSGGGVLSVEADQYLIVGHRSYNAASSGTFGQYISSIAPNIGPQYLTGMRGGTYRTNLGMYNASDSINNVRIRMPGGTDRTETLAPYESRQLSAVQGWTGFNTGGDSAVLEGTGPFLSYVSVIDNATGDPTYFPGLSLKSEGVLAGISHAPGANLTAWRSDAYLHAPSGAEVSVTFVRAGSSGAGVAPQLQVSLAPGETAAYEDFVAQLGVGDAFGVLWFKATRPILAVARTYNLAGATTYGQSILPVSQSEYVATGSSGLFLFASKSPSSSSGSRANLAIVNATSATQTYTAEVLGPEGSKRGQVAISVPPLSMTQQGDVVGAAGLSSLPDCVVRVRGSAPFTGYLSVVDNRTGDASTVPPAVQDWERLTTQSVGPNGGTISASGIQVMIPAGALSSATDVSVFHSSVAAAEFDRYRTSDVYGVDGVPGDSFDVSLSITRNGPGVGNPYIAFQETLFSPSAASMTSAPRLIAANASPLGSAVHATVARDPEMGAESVRRAATNADATGADIRPSQVVWAITGYYDVKSTSGKFLVRYPVYDVFSGSADELAKTLDTSYSLIGGLGIDWTRRTRWPIVAQLIPFAADKDTRLAEEAPSKLGINYHWIDVNLHHLSSPADLPEMRAATGHELMHLAQFLYDPRNRYSMAIWPGPWFWMNEATAVWFEGLVRGNANQVSDIARANYSFLIAHGLEYPPGDPTDVQDHGYGASMFIQQLAALKGNTFIGDVIKQMANSTQTPVGSLETLTTFGTGSQWKVFTEKYASGNVASGFPTSSHMGSLAAGHKRQLDTATPPPVNFNFNMGDLSAWAGRVELRYAWSAGTRIVVNHTDPQASSRLVVYKQSGGTLTELGRKDGGGSITIDKADELAKASAALFFWVSNARASQPFTALTPMSIQVSVVKGSALPPFPDGTYDFRPGTVGGCASYGMGEWIMTVSNGSVSLKYGRDVVNVGVSGSGTVLPNPAGGYIWNLPWNYSYTAPDSQTDNVTANGTFDGTYLKGTLVKGSCRVDFTNVIVTLVKR